MGEDRKGWNVIVGGEEREGKLLFPTPCEVFFDRYNFERMCTFFVVA